MPQGVAPNQLRASEEWATFSSAFPPAGPLSRVGYVKVANAVPTPHVQDSVQQIWDYFEDISNGKMLRDKPESWTSNDIYPRDGFFFGFGAGWILESLREAMADLVFEKLFGERTLHTSKEGFRLVLAQHETPASFCTTCVPLVTSKILVRSLVVLSVGDSEHMKCRVRSKSTTMDELHMVPGDVLLFRSDLEVDEAFPCSPLSANTREQGAVMYCSVSVVAEDWTKETTVWDRKIDAYKQRRTTSYLDTPMPISDLAGRCYFRAAPPILSRRQAELSGLIPYNHGSGIQQNDDLSRARIRGVLLDDCNYEITEPTVRLPCPPLSIQLTSSDDVMSGQDKYLGGMASPCGRYIYGVPGHAKKVLRISVENGCVDCIGPSFSGKFKWLRGVEIPRTSMTAESNCPDGCCIALPCNTLSLLKVNPSTDEVYQFGNDELQEACENASGEKIARGWFYHGGNLANNGWIYCIPANATRIAKVHPYTDKVVLIGPTFVGGQKWYGGIVGSDGCIYGIPHNATAVLKIDPTDDSVSLLDGTHENLPEGNWKWHGGLAAGSKIIGFPNNSNSILVIDCEKSLVYTVGNGLLKSGRHRIPQDGRYKYLGGALAKDQKAAYLFPCDAERVLRYNVENDAISHIGPLLLDGENKFQNGFVGDDGCLYGIPQRAIGVLRIVPGHAPDGSDDAVDIIPCGENMLHVKDKFEGGVLGYDGAIYCIPLRARSCVKVIPSSLSSHPLK